MVRIAMWQLVQSLTAASMVDKGGVLSTTGVAEFQSRSTAGARVDATIRSTSDQPPSLCCQRPRPRLTFRQYVVKLVIMMIVDLVKRITQNASTALRVLFMAALRSKCGHYIFAVWFLLSFFFLSFFSSPNLSRRRLDVYHTSTHGVALVRI